MTEYDRKIASAFLFGIEKIQNNVKISALARLLEQGDLRGAVSYLEDALVAAGFIQFGRVIQNAIISGGDLSATIANANRVEFGFNVTETNTARFLENYRAELIRQVSEDVRETASQVIYRESSKGANPVATARKIRQSIGLTAHQESHVQNYREYLETLDRRALERKLRDSRFDPSVARSMREGQPLSAEKIDRMVERYRQRYIKRRAETIARTESMTMIQSGQDQYWDQLVNSGVVDESRVIKKWIYTRDSKTRHSHRAIPDMNPNGVPKNEAFQSPLGLIRYPGDPRASASNRINCRCGLFYRILGE